MNRFLPEFFGTFTLILLGILLFEFNEKNKDYEYLIPIFSGIITIFAIYICRFFGGAGEMNPIRSITIGLNNKNKKDIMFYILTQILGGISAFIFYYKILIKLK